MTLFLLPVLAMALASGATFSEPGQPGAPFYGLGQSKDGDSLMVGTREVRLFGIDAPEFDQTCKRNGAPWFCGSEAADHLSRLVTGRDVRCRLVSTDQYSRAVSRCTAGTTDINSAMVESGFATAFREYSSDYVMAEARAKAAKRGIWAGSSRHPGLTVEKKVIRPRPAHFLLLDQRELRGDRATGPTDQTA